MKEVRPLLFALAAAVVSSTHAICPCSIQSGRLTCSEGLVNNFPEDLLAEGCTLDFDSVWALEIKNQPLRILKDNAFAKFSNLLQISMPFNQIEFIQRDAFAGLSSVTGLILENNAIMEIQNGALDHLINLKFIDLRGNPKLERYTTTSWHFCELADMNELSLSDIDVYKQFEQSSLTPNYCTTVNNFHLESCEKNGETLDCSNLIGLGDSPCYMSHMNFTHILFNFPADLEPSTVDNYYEGESNKFFQDFNSQNGSFEHIKYIDKFTLYETKFDLSLLKDYTTFRTKEVTIKADTIYTSKPITINHKLNIQARVVSLSYPITMNMTKESFLNNKNLEAWAAKEEFYHVGKVLMNKRSYGLLTILQNVNQLVGIQGNSVCQPDIISVEGSGLDIASWYDTTLVNLNYVCARTLLNKQRNPKLVDNISTFMLGYVYNDTIVNKRETFLAAQKFKKLLELNSVSNVHNVPSYSVDTISDLASIMHSSMLDYKLNELQQESNLFSTSGRVQDMKIQFEIIEQQQQMYFEMEASILDAIWASADNNWNFSFEHRNGIEDQIGGSLNDIQSQMYEMQKNELTRALKAAEDSLAHIDAVIEKYQTQVDRLGLMTKASLDVQTTLIERLQENSQTMSVEFDKFEIAIEQWKHEQEVKAVWGIFKAMLSFGIGLATGKFEPEDIADAIDAIIEIEELLIELIFLIDSCNEIQDMIEDMDLDDLADIDINLSTSFKDVLQTAVDMKLKGSDFDEIERTATIKIDAMNQATDFEIEGADDVMMACTSVSDVGHQLIIEASDFANIMLQLAERNDELAVAKEDKNRTIAEIEYIQEMIETLLKEQEEFEKNRDESRNDYENQLKDMEERYANMTQELREEYRKNITASFAKFKDNFKGIAEAYNNQIYSLMGGIHKKLYGLKEHSMNQRAMIMNLFMEYCDADFYHTFTPCDDHGLPFMSDEIDIILRKLNDIQWNSVTANENIDGTPIEFSGRFIIDSSDAMYGEKKSYMVQNLKAFGEVDINLRELDDTNHFDDFWRVRIETLSLVLLDDSNFPIQSNGTTFGKEIQIKVQYPTIFTDMGINGERSNFLALNFACNSDYITYGSGTELKIKMDKDLG